MAPKNTRVFKFKLGKRGLILFIFGISFLLFFVYVFGVMVGKNIDAYPEKLSRGIPDMVKFGSSPERKGGTVAVREGEGGSTGEEGFDLTFYDTLMRKGDERREVTGAKGENPAGEVVKEQLPSTGGVQKRNLPMTNAGAANEKKPAISQSEQEKDKKPPLPVVALHLGEKTPSVKGKYLIQAVSYREEDKANRLRKRLKALGYSASVVVTELPGKGRWFRVVLGGFESRQEAQKVAGVVSKEIAGLSCLIRSVNGGGGLGIRGSKDEKKVSQGE